MKKFSPILFSLLFMLAVINGYSQGIYKWNLGAGGAWNVAGNWTLQSGIANGNNYPGSADSAWITLNSNATVTAVPAAIQSVLLDGSGAVTFTSSGTTTVTGYITVQSGQLVNGGAAGTLVFASGAHYNHAVDAGTVPTATWSAGSNCDITGIRNGNSGVVFTSGPYNTYEGPFGLNQTFYNLTWNCPNMASSISLQNSYPVDVQGTFTVINTGLKGYTTALDLTSTGNNVNWTGGMTIHGGQLDLTKTTSTSTFTFSIGGNFYIDRMALDSALVNATEPQLYLTQGLSFSNFTKTVFEVGGNLTINLSTPTTDYIYAINFPTYYQDDATLMVAGNWSQLNSPLIGGTTNGGVTGCKVIFNGTGVHTFSSDKFFTNLNPLDVTINSGDILDMGNSVINNYGAFTLSSGAGLMSGSKYGITSSGTGPTSGNIQNTNTGAARSFNANASYTYYNAYGTGRQVTGTGLPATITNLTIGQPNSPFYTDSVTNVSLLLNTHVSGTFTLDSGLLYLGSDYLTLSSTNTASLAGSPSTHNMVVADDLGHGLFVRSIATGSNSYLFPVGDSTLNYTPVTLSFATNSTAGTIGVRVTNATEPNNNTPSPPAEYLSRYWTFANTSLSTYTYTGGFGYPTANIVGAETLIKLSQWTGSAWFEDDTGSSAISDVLTLSLPLNQSTAPLTGDFTGRTQLPPAGCTAPILTAKGNGVASVAQACTGSNLTLTANAIGGSGCSGNFEYAWSNGTNYWNGTDFLSVSPVFNTGYNNLTITATVNGSFAVSGRCSADSTCTSSSSVTVNVTAPVTPTITISSVTDTVCSGINLQFSANILNGGNAPIYQWVKNGNNTGSNSATYSSNSLADNDVVSCILTSNATCAIPASDTSNSISVHVIITVNPTIDISSPQTTICSGTIQTLTANATNQGTSPVYEWKKNGINVGTGATLYTDSFTNNDQVVCVLTSNATCASQTTDTSNTLTFTVNTTVNPFISVSAPQDTICSGSSLTFTANVTNEGTLPVYQWRKNGVAVGSSALTYTDNSIAVNDAYTCVLTSNAICVTPDSAISNVVIVHVSTSFAPTISINANAGDTICTGTQVTFNATTTGEGNSPDYQWILNNSPVGNNSDYTTSAIDNGDSVTCVLTSNASCANPATATAKAVVMSVVSNLLPSVTVHSTENGTCTGAVADFTVTTSNAGTAPHYQWQINAVNAGLDTSAFLTPALHNGDVIYCQLTSSASCANPVSVTSSGDTVIIFPVPVDTVIPRGPVTICSDDSIALRAPADDRYSWNQGGSDQTYYATGAGDYYVTVTDNNGCTAESNHVSVNTYPVPSVPIIVNGDTLSSFGGVAYQWYKSGQAIAGATAYFYVATVAGNYSVQISDTNGCKATSTSVSVGAMGIADLGKEQVEIYPNPSQDGEWMLEVSNEYSGSKIEVYDAEGRIIFQSEIQTLKSKISLNVASGIYYLRISGTPITRKMIRL